MAILLTRENEERYINEQDNCGIEEGDMVKITRCAETHEKGWPNAWTPGMNEFVGKTGKVSGVNRHGFVLDVDDVSHDYGFPYFVLEKIEEKE